VSEPHDASPLIGAFHRVRQTCLALTRRSAPAISADVFPNDLVYCLFMSLAAHDRRHLIAVYHQALKQNLDNATCQAALLHDIGKTSLAGRRVYTHERILHVLPIGLHPEQDDRVSGVGLARHHAAIGAERLRALGVEERVCWLVQNHDQRNIDDPQLAAFQVIDNATP
jgi:putative nucleotidyltransferase with HDIG domain